MKRFLSISVICLIAICCLVACKAADSKEKKENSIKTETDFEKPINYATIIEVSVNPVFKLYLDSDNKVLGIEPINDDAKSMISEIKYNNETANTVVTELIKCLEEKGFLKKGNNIDLKVIETQMSEKEQSSLMGIIEEELEETFDEVVIKSTIVSEKQTSNVNEENDKTDHDLQTNDSTSGKKTEKTSGDSKKDQSTQSTHTHTYSKATCTKPQTCSCGHTKGKKTGHKWTEATCSALKTCAICKVKEGNAVEHVFDDEGKCKWCKQVLPISPSKLKKGAYCFVSHWTGAPFGKDCPGISVIQLDFNKNEFTDADLFEYEYAYAKLGDIVEVNWRYKGKEYWDSEGGVQKFDIQILDNCIKLILEHSGTIELELLSNDKLKIIAISEDSYLARNSLIGKLLSYEVKAYHADWASISERGN